MQQEEEKGKLLTASQVAAIWNERAKEMGYPDTRYNRFAVRSRRESGDLPSAKETVTGYRYWEQDARAVVLHPELSSPKKVMGL